MIAYVSNEKHSPPDSSMETGVALMVGQVDVDPQPPGGKLLQKMVHEKSFSQLSGKKQWRFAWSLKYYKKVCPLRFTIFGSLGKGTEFDKLLDLLLGAKHNSMVEGAVVWLRN